MAKRITAGIDNRLISIVDIYPTLVELAGGEFPENQLPLDGESFAGFLKVVKQK